MSGSASRAALEPGSLLPLRRVQGVVTEMSDEALLAACALDDAAALGALFDRFQQAVFRFLMRYLGPAHPDIDDLVQATFLEVRRSAPGYRATASVRAWLLGIATNLARHHLRGETRRRGMLRSVEHSPPSPLRRPDDDTERRQLLQRLHQAITELPSDASLFALGARGFVVDFIRLPHWPVFNVADMLVVVGMVLLATAGYRRARRPDPDPTS